MATKSAGAKTLGSACSDAPIFLAERLGYFKEEGLRVEHTQFQSSEQMMPLLANAALDVSTAFPLRTL